MSAIMLPIAQAAPIAFLDAAVYAEIKDGGHPYVTGLAIAGGIFYLGPEGAILGPLLLCCLMVVLNLSSTFLRDTPSEERAALHSRVRSPDSRTWFEQRYNNITPDLLFQLGQYFKKSKTLRPVVE